ncbi:MAG: haloperoxidase [Crocinitomicaceae bacterium]|nr:haloperoxidase [Crocinitomicaceae bacterium]|tara:strand:+ start:342 stop:1814 length:1473 start_codon:yes stop_codon:yes gene_type:complete
MKKIFLIAIGATLFAACSNSANKAEKLGESDNKMEQPKGADNVVYKWGRIALDGTAFDTERFKPRPTITSRFLGLVMTSMFDTWTRFDEKAKPAIAKGIERVPEAMRTLENKQEVISYAAFRAMNEYYFSDTAIWKERMVEMGYDPMNKSLDPSTPAGLGNLIAKTIIEQRKTDGSNQYGELTDGMPYKDYSGYAPINSADENVDINRWQPKYFSDGNGGSYAPGCLTPYWQKVKPLLIDSASQFRPGPPPAFGTEQLKKEVEEVVDLQANLTNEQKALVEFMRDGPKSVQQGGHWLVFAQEVSIRDQHTLDEDVKMYFLVESVAMDGFIANWDSKMFYDYARPYALVHEQFKGKTIAGWAGEEAGWKEEIPGEQWRPYSPAIFLCPPFPSYASGHSTISGDCAEVLRLYKGSDEFGSSVDLVPGIMTEPNNIGDTVTLNFPTFTKAAEMAGMSRVLGGYHIQADNIAGLELGRDVARHNFAKYKALLGE